MGGLSENAMEIPTKMSLIREAGFGCYVSHRAFDSPQTE
jgi:hypothetical protein